jgi:hypothetical protein
MPHLLLFLGFALGASMAMAAEPIDPLKSPACEQALQRLQRQEAQAASAPQARTTDELRPLRPDVRMQALRREAARVCLGSRLDVQQPPPPQRQFLPPIGVAPVAPPAPVLGAPQPLPPVAIPRGAVPTVITSCDPTGCWASDGTRLNRMGPSLLGPRGLCTVQGNLLQCP